MWYFLLMTQPSPHHERLRLRQLRLLDLIETHGSLRAIGDALNMTQPAVSQMLKDLELAMGVTLVERSVRGVRLSSAGRIARQRLRPMLSIFRNLAIDLSHARPPVVRIGANPALMERVLPDTLALALKRQPGLQFQLRMGTVSDMLGRLLEGRVDCFVGRIDWWTPPSDLRVSLQITPVFQSELLIVCRPQHPLAQRVGLTVSDLAAAEWILQGTDSTLRPTIEGMFRGNGFAPPVPRIEINAGPHQIIRLAQALDLVACVPARALEAELARGELRVLRVPEVRFPPIRICFLTLQGDEAFEPALILRESLAAVVGRSDHGTLDNLMETGPPP